MTGGAQNDRGHRIHLADCPKVHHNPFIFSAFAHPGAGEMLRGEYAFNALVSVVKVYVLHPPAPFVGETEIDADGAVFPGQYGHDRGVLGAAPVPIPSRKGKAE